MERERGGKREKVKQQTGKGQRDPGGPDSWSKSLAVGRRRWKHTGDPSTPSANPLSSLPFPALDWSSSWPKAMQHERFRSAATPSGLRVFPPTSPQPRNLLTRTSSLAPAFQIGWTANAHTRAADNRRESIHGRATGTRKGKPVPKKKKHRERWNEKEKMKRKKIERKNRNCTMSAACCMSN